MRRTLRFSLLALLFLPALLAACDDSSASQATTPTSPAQASATSAPRATPTTTSTPYPAATSGSIILGGDIGAFISQFGQPNSSSSYSIFDFLSCGSSNIDEFSAQTDAVDGSAYETKVNVVSYSPCASTVDASIAYSTCQAFLPLDAVQQQSVPQLDSTGQVAGVDVIYASSWLANQFPASQFTDNQGNQVQPGLLDVYYYFVTPDGSQIQGCDIATGDSQLQN